MRVGIDTGGTFTDCILIEGSRLKILKVFSTPDSAEAILDGLRQLLGPREPLREPLEVIHGTTVGTNTFERRGARVALVTTAGFEDLIEIGRQNRPRLYDFNVQRDPPLVPRGLRWGVYERTAADGKILLKPRAAEIRRLASRIKRAGAESIALCFLFSFANPVNERTVARLLRELGIPVSVSYEILPEFREYERLSTVVINAYLAPRIADYLNRLEGRLNSLPDAGKVDRMRTPAATDHRTSTKPAQFAIPSRVTPVEERPRLSGRVFVMQSNGGITTAVRASREPVRTILSGPAGGVVAAAWLAQRLRMPRAISFDMGGTSTDVSLFQGSPHTTRETTLGGLPVAAPVLDIHSVGAGGGSIARLDTGGALRVGPESAGAVPGPACYGRGGTQPTVADANLILGRLDPEHFLGGSFRLNLQQAEESFDEFLRRTSQPRRKHGARFKTPVHLARGIVAVANATMERALRVISVERGHDPRDFALVCFGGAGGLHAADLARALGLVRVIVPQNPGAFSALGVLLSDIIKDVSHSVLIPVPGADASANVARSDRAFSALLRNLGRQFYLLEQTGRKELEHPEAAARSPSTIVRSIDVRYSGQAYELSVPFTPGFPQQFHLEHEKAYGYAHASRPLEIVNLRVCVIVPTPKPEGFLGNDPPSLRRHRASSEIRGAIVTRKPVYWDRGFESTPLYDRDRLRPGARITGPAVVLEYSSTTVIPPDYVCRVDEHLNLLLSRN